MILQEIKYNKIEEDKGEEKEKLIQEDKSNENKDDKDDKEDKEEIIDV